MRTSWHWQAACIVALCCAGCTTHEARWGGGAASSSGSGASVKELWRAHGNPGAWRKHSAVSFAYSVESLKDAEQARFAEVAFRLDDYRHLWVRKEGEDALTRLDLSKPLEWQGSRAIGCALHTLRYLFSVPVASAWGRWEFRSLLAPSDVITPDIFEAAPLDSSAAVGACRLERNPETGLMSHLTYVPRHPFAAGELRRVTFDSYVLVGEAHIALIRKSSLFVEELAHVRFLDSAETDQRLELEAPEPAAPRK